MENGILYRLKLYEGKYFNATQSMAGKWLNYKLLKVEAGYIESSILVRDELTNPNKTLHGGMFAMIFDEMCGLAFYSLGNPSYYTTVNLIVDFLFSAPLGSTVIAKAKVLRSGKKIANVECYLYNEENQILGHATSNLVNTEKEVFKISIEEHVE